MAFVGLRRIAFLGRLPPDVDRDVRQSRWARRIVADAARLLTTSGWRASQVRRVVRFRAPCPDDDRVEIAVERLVAPIIAGASVLMVGILITDRADCPCRLFNG